MKHRKSTKRLTKTKITELYGMTEDMILKYLPEPKKYRKYYKAAPRPMWDERVVQATIAGNPELKRKLEKMAQKKREQAEKEQGAIDFLTSFSPETLFQEGAKLRRKFHLHVGPTNSGKTYDALKALKACDTGVYLGPLRLLALEVAETLNREGYFCNLLTGEESIEVPFAYKTASTIELCDYDKRYDVAVIDEAQMLEDPYRGAKWVKAISLVDAADVYICLAPEALPIIKTIMKKMSADYEIVEHERLVPLKYSGEFTDIKEVQPGDALITFSRKKVLQIAAKFEKRGVACSVIYGALPPGNRREEVRRFSEGETRVVVATDAIGMGISLPIRRVIFTETEKYDGKRSRGLTRSEIKQIAGRAGRFGKYDLGEVLTMSDPDRIKEALEAPARPIERLTVAFPEDALLYDYPLDKMLETWNNLPKDELFSREDMTDALKLYRSLFGIDSNGKRNSRKNGFRTPSPWSTDKKMLYNLITCPVDTGNDDLVFYWAECAANILRSAPVRKPYFSESSLEECELQYHAYDIYHQLLRRIGIEDDCIEEKTALIEKINEFLQEDKTQFLKKCRICGREMRIGEKYNICTKCYMKGFGNF